MASLLSCKSVMSPCLPNSSIQSGVVRCSQRLSSRSCKPAHRRPFVVTASLQSPQGPKGAIDNVVQNLDFMLRRYDFVSTGMGAMVVTSYCVARGQDPWTALSITATATVVGLVANELLFNKGCQ